MISHRPELLGYFKSIFSPPFKHIEFVVWGYFLFCYLVTVHGPILRGDLPDTDDYIYLTQALDLLHGQNWFDHIQHRMNPPEGTYIHFSNLLAGFYALPIMLLKPLLGEIAAATVVAVAYPAFFFLAYLFSTRWAAAAFIGREWAGAACFIVLFAGQALYQFALGHVDHHGLEALFAMLAVGGMARMISSASWRSAVLTASVLSLALIIGLEILPVYLVIATMIGLWAMAEGKAAARCGAIFGVTLAAESFVLLLQDRGFGDWLTLDTLSYSIVYVLLAAGIGACMVVVAIVSCLKPVWPRYVVGFATAAAAGALYLKSFPMLLAGPYGAVDPQLAKLLFENMTEALPVIRDDNPVMQQVSTLLWPVVAFFCAVYFVFTNEQRQRRWQWASYAVLMLGCGLLVAFYQVRVNFFLDGLCAVAMVEVLRRGWLRLSAKPISCQVCAAKFGLLLLVAPIPGLLFPAFADDRSFSHGVLLFAALDEPQSCQMRPAAIMLNYGTAYQGRSLTIMDTIDEGAEILFRTKHKVISAPYHMNVSGNLDSYKFFTSTDPAEAKKIIDARHADMVLFCGAYADMYVPKSTDQTVRIGDIAQNKDEAKPLIDDLAHGKAPAWLKKVQFPLLGGEMLYDVVPEKQAPASTP